MAHLFGDSFDLYTASADLLPFWTAQSAVSLVTGRYGGGQAISINNNSTGATKTLGADYTTLIILFDYKRTAGAASAEAIVLKEGATAHVNLYSNGTTNQFSIVGPGGTIATTPLGYAQNVWWHMQLKVTIGDSANVTLYIDGSEVINTTGDTKNGGTGVINGVGFISGASGAIQVFDNVAIWDTSGSTNNALLTQIPRYYLLSPTSEGFQQDFTPSTGTDNSLLVDDVPMNSDTDYNSSSTLDALDLFNMSDLPITTGTILAVQSKVFARREDSGTRTVAPIFRINSTNYVTTSTTINDTYGICPAINETNPDTSAAWTISDVNGVQAGYKITA